MNINCYPSSIKEQIYKFCCFDINLNIKERKRIIRYIIDEYKITKKYFLYHNGRTVFETSIKNNQLKMLKFICSELRLVPGDLKFCKTTMEILGMIMGNNNTVEDIEWFLCQYAHDPLSDDNVFQFAKFAIIGASRSQNLNVIKFLHSVFSFKKRDIVGLYNGEIVMNFAIKKDKNALTWFRNIFQITSEDLTDSMDFFVPLSDAVRSGDLDFIKWFYPEEGYPSEKYTFVDIDFRYLEHIFSLAIKKGYLEVVKQLYFLCKEKMTKENVLHKYSNGNIFYIAATEGTIEILDWLSREYRLTLDDWRTNKLNFIPLEGAAYAGRLEIVNWFCRIVKFTRDNETDFAFY